MIKCCIFDLDGTLLYTLGSLTHYVNLILSRHGIGSITEEQCRCFIGNGARMLLIRSLSANGVEDEDVREQLLSEFMTEYNKDTLYLVRPYENIPELLSSLRARNIKLAVLSNKPDSATQTVISGFFPGAFDKIFGAREGIPLKPAPDSLIALISELGFSPDEIMYIGDTGVDMQTARGAGARCAVGVSWGYRDVAELVRDGADVIVDSPLEILGEVDSLA